jgi:hypothetical protein
MQKNRKPKGVKMCKVEKKDQYKVRVWNAKSGYYLPEFFLDEKGDVFVKAANRTGLYKFERQENFEKERCTGIADQFGKLIFQGDVVEMYNPCYDEIKTCVVEYRIEGGTAQWLCKFLHGERRKHASLGCVFTVDAEYLDGVYCEVVGNVHQDKFRDAAKLIYGEKE